MLERIDANMMDLAIDDVKKLKKDAELSEDQIADIEDEIQKLVDQYVKKIDEAVDVKTQELMQV